MNTGKRVLNFGISMYLAEKTGVNSNHHVAKVLKIMMYEFIHSFILETYIAPLQETTTQRCSQPSHGQKRRTSERCKIWKGGPSARNAAQRGDHSMLMYPQPKRPFAA